MRISLGGIRQWFREHPKVEWGCVVVITLLWIASQFVGAVDDAILLAQILYGVIQWLPLVALWVLMVVIHWPEIRAFLWVSPFTVTLNHGDMPNADRVVIASIGVVVHRKMKKKCVARLLKVIPLHQGNLLEADGWLHMKHNPCYLEWARQERSASGDHHLLDIPADSSPRILQVARADYKYKSPNFELAVPKSDRPPIHDGWYKLVIELCSEDDAAPCSHQMELLLGWSGEEPRSNLMWWNPITLDYWIGRGERILESQRKAIADRRAESNEQK